MFCHPQKPRPWTVREGARLQTFPDTFQFQCQQRAAKREDTQILESWMKQVGNAVPPRVAELVGKKILMAVTAGQSVVVVGVDPGRKWVATEPQQTALANEGSNKNLSY